MAFVPWEALWILKKKKLELVCYVDIIYIRHYFRPQHASWHISYIEGVLYERKNNPRELIKNIANSSYIISLYVADGHGPLQNSIISVIKIQNVWLCPRVMILIRCFCFSLAILILAVQLLCSALVEDCKCILTHSFEQKPHYNNNRN